MKKEEKRGGLFLLKGNRTNQIVAAIFALICLTLGILCQQYYRHLQTTIKEESSGYLQEISKHISKNASKTLNDNFSVLGTISTVLQTAKVTTYEQLQPIVQAQQSYWNYQSILLIDESGVAYDAYGNKVSLGGDQYLQDVVLSGKRSMSASQVVNGNECIVFAIPMQELTINSTNIRALAATYDLSTFDQILSVSAFNGEGYAHIIRRDGTIAVRSSSENATVAGYNVLTSLANAQFDDGSSLDRVREDIAAGYSGQVAFTLDNVREYLVYTPLDTQEWSLLAFVPVSVVNAKSEMLMKVTLLLCGFITVAFALLTAFLMLSFYRHKSKLEQIAFVDPVTGGQTIQKFYEQAEKLLEAQGKPQYALIYTNIEKFKVLNEQFGRRACDEMLCALETGIAQNLSESESMGRLSADNFCVLTEYTDETSMFERFQSWYEVARKYVKGKDLVWLMPIIEFGVYVVSNDTMPIPHMIDRAKLALAETTQELRGKLRCAVYDDAVRKRLFREKHLEDMMEQALKDKEFHVFLQPKYRAKDEQVGGAEALVRWVSKAEGMIYPDEFIALFEKNGFIIQLDLWIFEQVCKKIRFWLDQGLEPIKISVNCSRIHLKNPDFIRIYRDICTRCNVPTQYLEIELTENVVFEDVGNLSHIIDEIHGAGFGCSMDDFGSGYSSLNMIQNIPVDTIKLDKIFFRSGIKDLQRTESVVGSILTMSRSLSLLTVAEGVEEREQVDMLKRLGCDYIQGYYFAKPMPVADFEKLAFGTDFEKNDRN